MFETKSIHTDDYVYLLSPIVEDFNNDNRFDIGYLSLLFIGWSETPEM